MAIDIRESVDVGQPGGGAPSVRQSNRPSWLGQHLGTAIIGAVAGYALGHFIGNSIASGYVHVANSGQNDVAVCLGLAFGVFGWLAGVGALNYPLAKLVGKEAPDEIAETGWGRYFRYTLDHKVVGQQYVIGVLLFLFTGGLLAMAIRTELLYPTNHLIGPGTYIAIVGEHGTIMMMMATSIVIGPLGNWLTPLLVGSRRMAFPRIEAFSFWIFTAGYLVILTALPLGGFPTGWTGYAPLQTESGAGMDSYLVGFAVIGTGMILAGFNMAVTIINHRAPGMSWGRVPIFAWSLLATSSLLTLATPLLFVAGLFGVLDRTALTAFFVNEHGGSSFLWENLFWFFGHPEVYIMALPGFGIVAEMLPVFCGKPLFAYRVGAAGMVGVALLSFFVWQHHLFQSGINPDMRPLFMLTTELISIPTGFIYLVGLGTLWRAKIRFEVPMLFCLALYFNFLIGGITGVFLSDVPVNVTLHGSFFVMAHFHYTIMGGLVFAFFGGLYYWLPKMTGYSMNKRLGQIHFWVMFIFFNLTFFPLFVVGLLGMPRRVFEYASGCRASTISRRFAPTCSAPRSSSSSPTSSGRSTSTRGRRRRTRGARCGLEWQTPTPVPFYNFERIPVILSDPYHYGEENPLPVADLGLGGTPVAAAVLSGNGEHASGSDGGGPSV